MRNFGSDAMSKQLFRMMKMPRKEIMQVFRSLDPPELREMNGEFRATLLDQGRWANNFFTNVAFNLPGVWISKSFTSVSDHEGCGYNTFRIGAKMRKIYRMKTYVGPSNLDGRQSYHLDYGKVERQDRLPAISKLAGEIRKLEASTYLGIGTADFGFSVFRREQPFILQGPMAEYDESVWAA
jgi:hypothetical protein